MRFLIALFIVFGYSSYSEAVRAPKAPKAPTAPKACCPNGKCEVGCSIKTCSDEKECKQPKCFERKCILSHNSNLPSCSEEGKDDECKSLRCDPDTLKCRPSDDTNEYRCENSKECEEWSKTKYCNTETRKCLPKFEIPVRDIGNYPCYNDEFCQKRRCGVSHKGGTKNIIFGRCLPPGVIYNGPIVYCTEFADCNIRWCDGGKCSKEAGLPGEDEMCHFDGDCDDFSTDDKFCFDDKETGKSVCRRPQGKETGRISCIGNHHCDAGIPDPGVDTDEIGSRQPNKRKAVNPKKARALLAGLDMKSTLGNKNAPVTLVMFQDLKCGMCKRAFNKVLPKLTSKYLDTGIAKLVVAEFPLIVREPEMSLAIGAKCAADQNKYKTFVSKMYEDIKKASKSRLGSYVKASGMNKSSFNKCMANKKTKERVLKDLKVGKELKVTGTPTYFINGEELMSAGSFENLARAIEKARGKKPVL